MNAVLKWALVFWVGLAGLAQAERIEAFGVSVLVPEGYEAAIHPGRIDLIFQEQLRVSRDIRLGISNGAPTFPPGRIQLQDDVWFVVTESEGGSGGALYALVGQREVGGRVVQIEAHMQSEFGEPDFAWAFEVIGNVAPVE